MIDAEWRDYESVAEMADAVTDEIGQIIDDALAGQETALIALPGGKSPVPIFQRLAKSMIDWKRVTIIPTDDRLVPITSPLSNVAMIAHHFLPTGAHILPIIVNGTNDYHAAGEAADQGLSALNWPLDLVWLGVGADGHTASILPGPDLEDALDGSDTRRALGVMPDPLPPEAPVPRVTLSRAAILSARALVLTFSGTEKRAIVERALKEGAASRTPIGRVLANAKVPIDIHWSAS